MANFLILSVLFACLIAASEGSAVNSWWSLGVTNCAVSETCNNCDELSQEQILTDTQVAQCTDNSQALRAVAAGIRSAIIQCHEQFKDRKWTCSALESGNNLNLFGTFINEKRTRETAVLYAFLVAGATQRLAQFCHEGKINDPECQCAQAVQTLDEEDNIIFKECNENVDWAQKYIQNFTTSPYRDLSVNDPEAVVDFHNIEVGRNVMNRTEEYCKCHGVSGTCTVQTCYQKAPAIDEVSESLYLKYDGAVKVELVKGKLQRNSDFAANPLQDSDLAYSDDTPDLCVNATKEGVPGTAHRECDPSESSSKSCSVLCCGRGYYPYTEIKEEEKCAFKFCCSIECTTKQIVTTTYKCNP